MEQAMVPVTYFDSFRKIVRTRFLMHLVLFTFISALGLYIFSYHVFRAGQVPSVPIAPLGAVGMSLLIFAIPATAGMGIRVTVNIVRRRRSDLVGKEFVDLLIFTQYITVGILLIALQFWVLGW